MDRITVLFDADCGFCRWSADKLASLDRRGALRFVPITSAEGVDALAALSQASRLASWHALTGDGRLYSAGAAVPVVARSLRGGRGVAALAEAFPGATDAAYRLLARNRVHLGRFLGQRACTVDPSRKQGAA